MDLNGLMMNRFDVLYNRELTAILKSLALTVTSMNANGNIDQGYIQGYSDAIRAIALLVDGSGEVSTVLEKTQTAALKLENFVGIVKMGN